MADIRPRLFRPPKGSYFLFGPRGSGKRTWLRHLHPDAHWIDLLDEGRFQSYLVDPSLFSSEMDALADRSTVVVDEVQHASSCIRAPRPYVRSRASRCSR